jgi:hypothetical protein
MSSHLRTDLVQQLAHVLHRLVGLRAGVSRPDQLALRGVDRVAHLAAHENPVAGDHHAAHVGLDVAFRVLIADIVQAVSLVRHGRSVPNELSGMGRNSQEPPLRRPGDPDGHPDMPSFMALPIARSQAELKAPTPPSSARRMWRTPAACTAAFPPPTGWPGRSACASNRRAIPSGYVQDLDVDVFEHLKVMDFGDAAIPDEANYHPNAENILQAQAAVEDKVNQALDVGAVPIVIGQNSPCGSYAIAKPIAERTKGNVGMISFDTHWDSNPIDRLTKDPRIAGSSNWKAKTYEMHANFTVKNLVEIGERGMLEPRARVDDYKRRGIHFYPMWRIRTDLGIEGLCREMRHAYEAPTRSTCTTTWTCWAAPARCRATCWASSSSPSA